LTAGTIYVLVLFMYKYPSAARIRMLRRAKAALERAGDLHQRLLSTASTDELCRLVDAYCRAGEEVRTAIALAAELERQARRRREAAPTKSRTSIEWPPAPSSSVH
jgi:hypothetical protein